MTEPTLGLLVLRSSCMEEALAFYRAIGLVFAEEKHGSGPIHYACQLGITVLEIYPANAQDAQDHRASGATLLGFRVACLEAVLERMTSLDVTVLTMPKSSAWGRRAVVKDPDGRAVELSEAVELST